MGIDEIRFAKVEILPGNGQDLFLDKKTKIKWIDPIWEALPEHSQGKYLEMISEEIRQKLVFGLAGTKRWMYKGQIVNPEFKESNLDHVLELIAWCNEIENNYPNLWREVCGNDLEVWQILLAMIIMHDSGEIVVGDICRSDPDFDQIKGKTHKIREKEAAEKMIKMNFNPLLAALILKWYERFDLRNNKDRIVMLGHLLDKGQASQNVAIHLIPFNVGQADYDVKKHFSKSQFDTLIYAENLFKQLKTRPAKSQLAVFLNKKIIQHFEAIKNPDVLKLQHNMRRRFGHILTEND